MQTISTEGERVGCKGSLQVLYSSIEDCHILMLTKHSDVQQVQTELTIIRFPKFLKTVTIEQHQATASALHCLHGKKYIPWYFNYYPNICLQNAGQLYSYILEFIHR